MATPNTPQFHLHRPRRGEWLQFGHRIDFEWNQVRLEIPRLPPALAGLRIVHLTDLHLRADWNEAYDRLIAKLQERKPDLILVTGDLVDDKHDHTTALPTMYRLIDAFRAPLGAFAIMGNHDRLHFGPRLDGSHVQLLSGQRRLIAIGDAGIELIGLPGAIRKHLTREFVASIPPPPAEHSSIRIVLSHFPDHLRRTRALRPDLFLAGHTHGGQICLPGEIPLLRHDTLPRQFCHGVHRVNDTWLIVGRGFGTTTLPIRLFCPPEVIEIELAAMPG